MVNVDTERGKSKDIKIRSYEFSVELVRFIRSLPREIQFNPIINQLIRCGTSIGANIAEAQGAHTHKDFGNFYDIALKSGRETIYWLTLCTDGLGLNQPQVAILNKEAEELSRMIGAGLISLRKQ